MSFLTNFISGIKNKYTEELNIIPEKEALDAFIYGINCNRIILGNKNQGILSLSDKILNEICFLNKKQNKIINIQINHISDITFNNNSENLKKYNRESPDNNNEEMVFIQISVNQIDPNKKELGNYIEDNLEILFDKNNVNFDEILDQVEFQNLAKDIGIEANELLLYIDKNKDGIITKEEVINYFKDLLKGLEFKDIFEKYATKKNSNEYTMNPEELKLFFHKEEKEFINDLEAYQLIILFKSNIDKEIKRKICKKFKNNFFYNKYQINKNEIVNSLQKL